ncbi:unnamed protein product [Rotaria socialis]|uniref:CABIT domain-containing protein n=1 Tax=Rotaria socialis TaxID=392032 RepID=A0A818EE22_9BILA|nr:unnamed protein product [Rotaria socialis]CAF4506569.1 unnamed protein product [Rotaria socialis]CAF4611070.1 unnamed protein product [Rotaria socialis]
MHYLLGGQHYYFPSSDEQSYTLEEFLDFKCNSEHRLPTVVRITALNNYGRIMKSLVSKDTPLLLLDIHQFESILAEYYSSNDRKYHSNKHRFTLNQGKLASKATAKFRNMKKLSTSLVTLSKTNLTDDNSDDDFDNMRIIIRNLNQKRSSVTPLCRIPINYHGFFELLNENDQAIKPFHKLSNLLITEYKDENNQQIPTQKWPNAFFLRSICKAYTKRYIPGERKLSGSADSCYGSLSDLDPQKNLLILNDDALVLQPGQIITIINQCSAYRSQTPEKEANVDQFASQSSSSWFRNKSRFFFLRKKPQSAHSHATQHATKNIYDISKRSEPYLKCQAEQGDIVYISIHESGLFSSINSQNNRSKSTSDSEHVDISGVFQLHDLLGNFRFPLCVNLLNNSISFDSIYAPANINQYESPFLSLTKFRLLLPYTENVIFACPLVIPSSFKSQVVVIPIPINSDIEVQRCLNMREITANRYYHNLIQVSSHIMNQYKTEFSYVHFPLVLNTTTKQILKRKQPLFKKRSQSESHIEYYASDLNKSSHRKSCEIFHHNDESDAVDDDDDDDDDDDNNNKINNKNEKLHHRDSYEKIKQRLTNNLADSNQRQQSTRRSGHYAKIKTDKPRKYSRQQDADPEDENYRELDHIYDYIRSGDITDDIQRIQEKEQALNKQYNELNDTSQTCESALLNESTIKTRRSDRRPPRSTNNNSRSKEINRFSHNLDDSRPYNNASDDDIHNVTHLETRRNTYNTVSASTYSKPIIKMNRSNRH